VISTNGGLLEAHVSRDYLMLAPGERAELWVDFTNRKGAKLVSLPFDAGSNTGMLIPA
jgi:blue copper oxidase